MGYVIKETDSEDYYYDLDLDTWIDEDGCEYANNHILWAESDINARQFASICDAEKELKEVLGYIDYMSRKDFEIVEVK